MSTPNAKQNAHDDEDAPPPLPSNAEDAQRVKAMSSMDAADADHEGGAHVDSGALNSALAGLSVKEKAVAAPVAVKVDPAHVAILMEETMWTKPKATEYMKKHKGDLNQALMAVVAYDI